MPGKVLSLSETDFAQNLMKRSQCHWIFYSDM